MNQIELQSRDGVTLPISWFPADDARWTLLFLPALGIQCRFYNRLAELLSASACSVCLMEQRGHGRSPLRASRKVNWGYDEYLQKDIPATLEWIQEQPGVADLPLILAGHSLGGHLSTLYSGQHPEMVKGVIHVACGAPYYGDFSPMVSLGVRFLCHVQAPLRLFPGYFPGALVGFAGRESLRLMKDWRYWATTGRFDYGPHTHLHDDVSRFTGPVLSVGMAGDQYSSKAAERRAVSPFINARISQVRIGDEAAGDSPGHFGWAKEPERTGEVIVDWLNKKFDR